MTQATIFDQADRRKQEGIELVYRHADTEWKRAAAERLRFVAETREYFTSDDVLIYLEKKGITTGDNRAIAAILQAFNRAGLITSTDKFVRCRRPQRHGAPIMVWRSNMVKKQKEAA